MTTTSSTRLKWEATAAACQSHSLSTLSSIRCCTFREGQSACFPSYHVFNDKRACVSGGTCSGSMSMQALPYHAQVACKPAALAAAAARNRCSRTAPSLTKPHLEALGVQLSRRGLTSTLRTMTSLGREASATGGEGASGGGCPPALQPALVAPAA